MSAENNYENKDKFNTVKGKTFTALGRCVSEGGKCSQKILLKLKAVTPKLLKSIDEAVNAVKYRLKNYKTRK